MVRLMNARYAGKCKNCGGPIGVGDPIQWNKYRGAAHADCRPVTATPSGARICAAWPDQPHYHYSNGDCDTEIDTGEGSDLWISRANSDYNQGVALGQHISDTRRFFGEAAALAEEIAWESRLGDY